MIEAQSNAIVEGHCDEADMQATKFASGWGLSINRAMALTTSLIGYGVAAGQLASYGYGQFNPLSRGENKKADFNRRVTILINVEDMESFLNEAKEADGEEEEASS